MQGETSRDATGNNWEPQGIPSDISDAIFAARLRAVREQAGMTQQQLADLMARTGNKIHRSTIGKIENADRPVTVGEAVQLASILGVPLVELVTMRDSQKPDQVDSLVDAFIHALTNLRAAMVRAQDAHSDLARAEGRYESVKAELKFANEKANEIVKEFNKHERGKEYLRILIDQLESDPATKHMIVRRDGE